MFTKPYGGWTDLILNEEKIGNVSYAGGAIIPTLESCHKFLMEYNNGIQSFNLVFNQEGSECGIVLINDDFYSWTNADSGGIKLLQCLSDVDGNWHDELEFVKKLSAEVIDDYRCCSEEWQRFEALYDEEMPIIKEKIKRLIGDIEELIRTVREPELGNLLFGNSRGQYAVPRDKWQDAFLEFLDGCGFDSYGYTTNKEMETKYLKTKESTDIFVNRDTNYNSHIHYFDNGTFMVSPYYWGDADDLARLPNFIYYPTKYELQWYKYPLRDSYANQDISFEEFKEMLEKCKESVKE